jgi:molecular chaperone GrpE
MNKNERSKTKNWEKLNSQVEQETTVDASAVKEEASTAKKTKSPANELTYPSYAALEEQLLKTETQLEENKNKLVQYKEQDTYRLAEMENIRRRCKLDIENAYKFSLEKFIKDLLPVKDSLEAALFITRVDTENDPILRGVKLTLQELQKILDKNGVKAIDPASGETFDAHYHQAMLAEENNQQSPNTILKVLQKGYLLNERLMRPAMVVVAKAAEENL